MLLLFLLPTLQMPVIGVDVCQPYIQLEDKLKCGSNGYLIHYGLRNCRNFNKNETRKLFTPAGNKFVDCTTSCLVGRLSLYEKDPSISCESLSKDAFDSHTNCYIDCNFCNICKTDKETLLKTYDLGDFFSFKAMKQVIQVAYSCSWFGLSCLTG